MKALLVVGLASALALVPAGETTAQQSAASRCPAAALPLGTSPLPAASKAALRREPRAVRPRVMRARIAVFDKSRGPHVRAMCGERAATRTVIVYVQRRAYLPAQSASQGVHFVSRFPGGFRVWFVAH